MQSTIDLRHDGAAAMKITVGDLEFAQLNIRHHADCPLGNYAIGINDPLFTNLKL